MAKRAKNDGGVDRINNFPDEICCRILSFLPTREAVRTSILSTRWRYLFAYLSNFDIDFRLGFGYRIDSFAKFMLKRLYFRTETLEHFRFRMKNVGETSDLDIGRLYDWISAALHRGVGELHLDFPHYMPRYHHHSLPSDMFICKTLVTLKLNTNFALSIPVNVFVPCLKTVEFRGIRFVHIGRLFPSYPVLEELSICDCYSSRHEQLNISNSNLKRLTTDSYKEKHNQSRRFKYRLVLNVPSLVYFKYADLIVDECSVANMHSLVKADITIFPLRSAFEDNQQVALVQLLQAMDHVKLLYLNLDYQTLLVLHDKPFNAFCNMVRLQVFFKYNDNDRQKATWLYEFLQYSPNLQTLVLSNMNPYVLSSPPEKVPSCLLSHLKEIEISVHLGDLEMVAYFLLNARVLEKLTIRICMHIQERQGIANKILMLRTSSKKCEVVFL